LTNLQMLRRAAWCRRWKKFCFNEVHAF
jgi:hypothetical protein